MLSASLVALFSLAAAVVAVPAGVNPFHGIELRATNDICGNNLTPDGISQMEKAFASLPTGDGPTDAATPDGTFTVPVYFNVIYAGNGISDGNVPLVIRPLSCPAYLTQLPFQGLPNSTTDQRSESALLQHWS